MKKHHEIYTHSLRDRLEDAQRQIEAREDMIVMASHELKTPISTMMLYLDLLKRDVEKLHHEELKTELDEVNSQLCDLTDLVDQMLDLSRIQGGKIIYDRSNFDINQLLFDVARREQKSTEKHKILVQPNKKKNGVCGDRDRIRRVVANIISNAIKYSEGGEIRVKAETVGKEMRVSVHDQGRGISPEFVKKIFDRFYQVPKADSRTGGLGFGLYMASRIIQNHGGRIWADSTLGKGSTFYFTIPLAARSGVDTFNA